MKKPIRNLMVPRTLLSICAVFSGNEGEKSQEPYRNPMVPKKFLSISVKPIQKTGKKTPKHYRNPMVPEKFLSISADLLWNLTNCFGNQKKFLRNRKKFLAYGPFPLQNQSIRAGQFGRIRIRREP